MIFFSLKILFIYLTERETASGRGNTSRGSGRGRSRLPVEEPDVGLDPRTSGSRPERKADAQRLSHPGAPILRFYLFVRESKHKQGGVGEEEGGSQRSREPNAGLDPRTLG